MASEILAGRKGAPTLPSPPYCPFEFDRINNQLLLKFAKIAKQRLGCPVHLQGPYTVEIIDWIEEHGNQVYGSTTLQREDLVGGAVAASLQKQIRQGCQVFFYTFEHVSDSGVTTGGQWGFIVFSGDKVVDVVVLRVA